MVEGKDAPPQVDKPFSLHGKMVGLLLRMLKSYFHTGEVYCIRLGLLCAKGNHQALGDGVVCMRADQKRQSWPVGVPGDVMQARFDRHE